MKNGLREKEKNLPYLSTRMFGMWVGGEVKG